jgi:hypothetical protein
MKAKEYANEYKEHQDIAKIFNEMFKEVGIISKSRNAISDDALASIFKEINQKWNAFARLSNDPSIEPDGFIKLSIHRIPALAPYFSEIKDRI